MLNKNRQLRKLLILLSGLLIIMACITPGVISPTQSSGTATPPFSPGQIGSAVAMTATALQSSDFAYPSNPVPFVPGDPTATPLGSDIMDPNFIAGLAAFDADDYDQTVTLMSAVIVSNQELAPPYRYRANSYWYLGECELGLADVEKALSINPDYAAAWAVRGLMYICFEDKARAVESFEKALSIDPSLAFAHINLGIYYYRDGDYQKAFEEYSLAAAIDPTRSDAQAAASGALGALGRYVECIEEATRAIKMNEEEWLAYSSRAFCHLRMNDYAAAAADYEIYLLQNSNDSIAWYNYGISQNELGDLQGTVDSYTKALELDPEYYAAYINRGNVYVELKQYQKALDDFNAALQFGDVPLAYAGRGDAYYGMEEYNQAVEEYKTALSMNPGSAHCHCSLALTYFELGMYQDVLDEAQAAYAIDPACGGAKLFEVQARSYYALGDYDQALIHINKALELDQYSLGYYYRGIIYQAAGRNQEAIQDLELFLSVSTNFPKEIADAEMRLKQLKK